MTAAMNKIKTFFSAIEPFMAYVAFMCAVLTLVWKTAGTLAWVPWLGPAFEQIFDLQYPRRPGDDESLWRVVYLCMYGVWGVASQYCGLVMSRNKSKHQQKSTSLVMQGRIFASFHAVIAVHHLGWACYSQNHPYGKLQLQRFNLPGVYVCTAVAALALAYHACQLLFSVDSDVRLIYHRKAVMDTATACTLQSFVVFWVSNLLGVETSSAMQRFWWGVTMYSVPVVVLVGTIGSSSPNTEEDKKSD